MTHALRIFVATRPEQVPTDTHPFVSVDGSVPGAALTWDHHVTGEPVNLDAMPDALDLTGLRGIGTTLADTDAVASVLAVLAGGRARLPEAVRETLHAASHRCDHLRPAPGASRSADAAGAALHRWVTRELEEPDVSAAFERVCRALHRRVVAGEALPGAPPREASGVVRLREAELPDGRVACFDLRVAGDAPPEELHAAHDRAVAVFVRAHAAGGPAYTVGVNPFHRAPPTDLSALLAALARAEHAHGPPCRCDDAGPGTENWGGRATVFGSPWNYGSRLSAAEVVRVCEAHLR